MSHVSPHTFIFGHTCTAQPTRLVVAQTSYKEGCERQQRIVERTVKGFPFSGMSYSHIHWGNQQTMVGEGSTSRTIGLLFDRKLLWGCYSLMMCHFLGNSAEFSSSECARSLLRNVPIFPLCLEVSGSGESANRCAGWVNSMFC